MSKKLIGLKLADGTFYPVLKEGIPEKKHLKLTASGDNQTSMKIELFRASDDSFQDAEYIQTLVLDQMIPQRKEDHLIDFVINLDEKNNLQAELNDAKSGIEKTATISLPVSGDDDFVTETPVIETSDELPDFNDIDIEESAPASAESADSIVEDFLSQPLAEEEIPTNRAADGISDESLPDFGDFDISNESSVEEPPAESLPDFSDFDTPSESIVEETPDESLPDFEDFDATTETSADDIVLESPIGETAEGLPVFDDIEESSTVSTDAADSVVEDFLSQPVAEEEIPTTRAADEISDESLPDFGDFDTSTEFITEEAPSESLPDSGDIDTTVETTTEIPLDEPLPDLGDIDKPVENSLEDPLDQVLPDFNDFDTSTETTADEPREEELPDFGDFDIAGGSDSVETASSDVEEADLPSFDDSDFADVGFTAASTASFADSSITKDSPDDFSPENFDIDLQLNSENDLYSMDLTDDADSFESDPQNRQSDDDTYTQSPGITDFDFLDKKARIPFVPLVCIICAVVSLLCMLGMFFLFLNGKSKNTVPVQPTSQEQRNNISVYTQKTEAETEKPVQAAIARDNVIVVVDSPVVVPAVPEKIVTAADEKKYKVKWGDTLWDIAESYYKNPWMYKKIASVNNIKNPDFILSGTWIVLPPK